MSLLSLPHKKSSVQFRLLSRPDYPSSALRPTNVVVTSEVRPFGFSPLSDLSLAPSDSVSVLTPEGRSGSD